MFAGFESASPFSPLDEHPKTPTSIYLWHPSSWNHSCSRRRSLPSQKTLAHSTPALFSSSHTTDERGSQQGSESPLDEGPSLPRIEYSTVILDVTLLRTRKSGMSAHAARQGSPTLKNQLRFAYGP
jgi:hypothetical protein